MKVAKVFLTSMRTLAAAFMVIGLGVNVAALAGGHKDAKPAGDIVAVAVGAGNFNTLVAAVQAADLVEALQGDGPLTVFAPTDEAFAALPPGTVENLLLPENKEQLQAVLLYHVVPGKIMSSDLKGTANVETLQGDTVEIVVASGVTVNGANVVAADVMASNGVIHAIDAVILPPE